MAYYKRLVEAERLRSEVMFQQKKVRMRLGSCRKATERMESQAVIVDLETVFVFCSEGARIVGVLPETSRIVEVNRALAEASDIAAVVAP